ncbi:MAG: BadF/BadG/BcrA/BcrD ATPase family protein [Gemmatimonadota bacterium]
MRYFVGVDIGGSHAEAAIVDDSGRELARGHGPGGVLREDSIDDVTEAVRESVRDAVGSAGLELPAAALWVGLAGAGRESLRGRAEALLSEADLAEAVGVGTDVKAAFESAFGDGPGLLLIAGTGSIALGRSPDGRMERVGGWGALLGDEGSGYWIAMRALGCIARAVDGRAQPTALEDLLMGYLGLDDPYALIPWTNRASKAEVAALAPLVLEAARAGDSVAASIVTDAAAALRGHVIALLERLEGGGDDPGASGADFPLVLWGGLIGEGGWLRSSLERLLEPLGLDYSSGPIDPAFGAARLAAGLVRASF